MSQFSVDTRRLFSYIFIGVLAALFALEWGPGSKGCDKAEFAERDFAATVNGKAIPLRDFAREYSQQVERFRSPGRAGRDDEAVRDPQTGARSDGEL